eukprot:scaffold113273_cov72-Phaeocystis_antarctica.AAC.1
MLVSVSRSRIAMPEGAGSMSSGDLFSTRGPKSLASLEAHSGRSRRRSGASRLTSARVDKVCGARVHARGGRARGASLGARGARHPPGHREAARAAAPADRQPLGRAGPLAATGADPAAAAADGCAPPHRRPTPDARPAAPARRARDLPPSAQADCEACPGCYPCALHLQAERYGAEGEDDTLDLNDRALRDRRRLQWILRPILIGAALHIGWRRPVAATGATRLAWLVHAAWPAAVVAGTAARSWLRPSGAPLPRANATLVLSTQHLLSQG